MSPNRVLCCRHLCAYKCVCVRACMCIYVRELCVIRRRVSEVTNSYSVFFKLPLYHVNYNCIIFHVRFVVSFEKNFFPPSLLRRGRKSAARASSLSEIQSLTYLLSSLNDNILYQEQKGKRYERCRCGWCASRRFQGRIRQFYFLVY